MRQTCYLFVGIFALGAISRGQNLARAEAEQRFREVMGSFEGHIGEAPEHDVLLGIARQAGMSRTDLQNTLLLWVDAGANAPANEYGAEARVLAARAMSVLGKVGNATVIPKAVSIAQDSLGQLSKVAVSTALYAANREMPRELPSVVHLLTKTPYRANVYNELSEILQHFLPVDEQTKVDRIATIVDLLKESFRDPSFEDRIYLDELIEKYDPGFRRSVERRQILEELSSTTNPIVQRYSKTKLLEYFPASGSVLPTASVGESRKREPSTIPVADPKPPTNSVSEASPIVASRLNLLLIVGTAVVAGLLAFFLWGRK